MKKMTTHLLGATALSLLLSFSPVHADQAARDAFEKALWKEGMAPPEPLKKQLHAAEAQRNLDEAQRPQAMGFASMAPAAETATPAEEKAKSGCWGKCRKKVDPALEEAKKYIDMVLEKGRAFLTGAQTAIEEAKPALNEMMVLAHFTATLTNNQEFIAQLEKLKSISDEWAKKIEDALAIGNGGFRIIQEMSALLDDLSDKEFGKSLRDYLPDLTKAASSIDGNSSIRWSGGGLEFFVNGNMTSPNLQLGTLATLKLLGINGNVTDTSHLEALNYIERFSSSHTLKGRGISALDKGALVRAFSMFAEFGDVRSSLEDNTYVIKIFPRTGDGEDVPAAVTLRLPYFNLWGTNPADATPTVSIPAASSTQPAPEVEAADMVSSAEAGVISDADKNGKDATEAAPSVHAVTVVEEVSSPDGSEGAGNPTTDKPIPAAEDGKNEVHTPDVD